MEPERWQIVLPLGLGETLVIGLYGRENALGGNGACISPDRGSWDNGRSCPFVEQLARSFLAIGMNRCGNKDAISVYGMSGKRTTKTLGRTIW